MVQTTLLLPDPDDDQDRACRMLQDIKLTAAARQLPEVLRAAQKEQMTYSRCVLRLLEHEFGVRRERKIERILGRSRLRGAKSLDEFDFSIRPKLTAAAVKQLLDCKYIDEGRSVICIGRPGTGKTHVSKALGHAACMKGLSVQFVNTSEMLEELHASLADNSFARVFRRYSQCDLLLLDEVGYLPLDEQKADYLFRLVSARHPARSMIVTTNTGFTRWGRFFPNEGQAMATVDRLLDQATVLRFTGKTMRNPREVLGADEEKDTEQDQ